MGTLQCNGGVTIGLRLIQVAAINLKRTTSSTQTESYTPTGTAVQTDWQAVHMPLPTPAGAK